MGYRCLVVGDGFIINALVVAPLIQRVRATLVLSQRGLGQALGVAKKTVMKWELHRSTPIDVYVERMARLVYPKDRVLAGELAAAMGETLASLGIEAAVAPKAPTVEHLVDSVLCAAAEAATAPPQAMRAGLRAAFDRMAALGLTTDQMVESLAGAKGKRQK